jgi:hypothetical protein
MSGADGPMRILSPMSEQDEAELESERRLGYNDDEEDGRRKRGGDAWSRKVERGFVKLSAEVAALREQITTGREWRSKKERSFTAWIGWLTWVIMKHAAVDIVVLCLLVIWMRKRKDRRLEDLVRAGLRLAREYIRQILPSR